MMNEKERESMEAIARHLNSDLFGMSCDVGECGGCGIVAKSLLDLIELLTEASNES